MKEGGKLEFKDPKTGGRRQNDAVEVERGYAGKMEWLGEVVLRAVGEYCVIGNGLEECLDCIRKLALGAREHSSK